MSGVDANRYVTTSMAPNVNAEQLLRWARDEWQLDPSITVEVAATARTTLHAWVSFEVAPADTQQLVDALTYTVTEQPVPVDALDFDEHGVCVHDSAEDVDAFLDGQSLAAFLGRG